MKGLYLPGATELKVKALAIQPIKSIFLSLLEKDFVNC
jgi:hypothetical protein